jgi:small subunit ribosomal protein S7
VKREVVADPIYNNFKITRFVNKVLIKGKKSTAESILYGALEIIKDKTKKNPIEVFETALTNASPVMEVKSRRVGGSNYQVPIEVRPERALALSIRWLVDYARERGGRSMSEKLAGELMDAYNKTGGAIKKREDTHQMAESNKAFAHFRW